MSNKLFIYLKINLLDKVFKTKTSKEFVKKIKYNIQLIVFVVNNYYQLFALFMIKILKA
jgi:hypothetical protein